MNDNVWFTQNEYGISVYPTAEELTVDSLKLNCSVCKKSYTKQQLLLNHLFTAHLKFKELLNKNSTLRYVCPAVSTHIFPNFWRLKTHYWKVHMEKTLICRFCKINRFSLEQDRRYHEKNCCERPVVVCGSADTGKQKAVIFPLNVNKTGVFLVKSDNGKAFKVKILSESSSVTKNSEQVSRIAKSAKTAQVSSVKATGNSTLLTRKLVVSGKPGISAPVLISVARNTREILPKKPSKPSQKSVAVQCDLIRPPQVVHSNSNDNEVLDHASQTGQFLDLYNEESIPYTSADIFCQTAFPLGVDASVSADFSGMFLPERADRFTNTPSNLELARATEDFHQAILLSTIETQTEDLSGRLDDIEEYLRTIDTQTGIGLLADIETQTQQSSFWDITSSETQT